jgi:type II secretory pathway pseudopilin PulG
LLDILFAIALIGILSGIAVPSLLRGRAAAQETSAIATMRSTHTAQLGYMLTCGSGFYAASFPSLGSVGGVVGFLPQELTYSVAPSKSGYTMTLAPGATGAAGMADCNGATDTSLTYYATAIPQTPGRSGVRGFATNQAGAIWEDVSGAAPVEPFTIGPGVSPVD